MPIEIETEKIVLGSGRRGRKILGIKALRERDLPELYKENYKKRPVVIYYVEYAQLKIMFSQSEQQPTEIINMYKDSLYAESEFQKMKEKIYQAGGHLQDVNRFLRKERESWNGPETFVI